MLIVYSKKSGDHILYTEVVIFTEAVGYLTGSYPTTWTVYNYNTYYFLPTLLQEGAASPVVGVPA